MSKNHNHENFIWLSRIFFISSKNNHWGYIGIQNLLPRGNYTENRKKIPDVANKPALFIKCKIFSW